jgi:hypothetical protein
LKFEALVKPRREKRRNESRKVRRDGKSQKRKDYKSHEIKGINTCVAKRLFVGCICLRLA